MRSASRSTQHRAKRLGLTNAIRQAKPLRLVCDTAAPRGKQGALAGFYTAICLPPLPSLPMLAAFLKLLT